MQWQLLENTALDLAPLDKLDQILAQGDLDDKSVHKVRQLLKSVRARLRLIRQELPAQRYQNLAAATRQLANDFTAAREFAVLQKTLCSLLDQPEDRATRERILQVMHAHTAHALPSRQQMVEDRQQLRQALAHAEAQAVAVAHPGKGLAASYKRCRKQWRSLRRWPEPESLHRWRRSVKHLQYQLQMLVPGQHLRYQGRIKQLGQLLGQLHDLHDLAVWQEHSMRWLWLDERLLILERIQAREAELMTRIMTLGKRLYRQRPSEFCRWQPAG